MDLLIAEDDPNLRSGLVELLELQGHTCVVATDGEAAWRAFQTRRPDLCIFDIMMPGLDGLDLCRMIKALDANLPILLLSARGDEIDRVIGLELGADDYISKPFSARELVARVKVALRRTRVDAPTSVAPRPALKRMGDLMIDVDALRAWRGAEAIDITARELSILLVLLDRAGKAVSRDELFRQAWGRNFTPNSHALDQYVSTLRRKVELDPACPRIISTVHGIGYRYDGATE
jgi:two-component system, OmpR family, alkaline phosphatase synthesis response regulator PhoP